MAVEYQVKYTPGFDPTIVNVSQNDVGRQFDLKIIDETGAAQQIPSGSTVKFVGMKPSGLGFTVNCTFTNSVVHVTTTDIMTDEHGLIPAEVQITKGTTVIGTANVNMRVEKNPHPDGTIDDNIIRVIPTFNAIFQRLNTLESSMSTAQNDISNLQTRMTTAEGTLSNVVGEVEQQSGAITNIGTELGGIRTGYDGTVYLSAGDAVRAQAMRIDDTLTESGKAADAKATGDKILANRNSIYGGLVSTVPAVIPDYYIANTGRQSASTAYVCTDFVDISNTIDFTVNCTIYTGVSLVVYDNDKNVVLYIDGYNASDYGITPATQPQTVNLTTPDNAKYMRASMRVIYYTEPSDFNIILNSRGLYSLINHGNTIYVGENEEYTSILEALKATDNSYKIHVKAGTYNIVQEYINYYGSDFWDNYNGYSGSTDYFLRGLWINASREIEFDSKAVVVFDYSGNNQNVPTYFSVFATGYNATIKKLHCIFNNKCRYAVHDDQGWSAGVNKFINCIFDGTSGYNCTIGGGMGSDMCYIISDCVFINNNGTTDISYHNNGGSTAKNKIFISNCYGDKDCKMLYHGTSTNITYCVINNNHFRDISKSANTASSLVDNMQLIEWANITI